MSLPERRTSRWRALSRRVFAFWLSAFFRFYCPLTVTGRENLPEGPFLLCANHVSHLDGAALLIACGAPVDKISLVAAGDYFFDHSWRRHLAVGLLPLVPIDRRHPARGLDDLRRAAQRLLAQCGRTMILFPTGSRNGGQDRPSFRRGVAIVAAEMNLPMVPALISGTWAALPPGSRLPRKTPVSVSFGQPIHPPRNGEPTRPWTQAATRRLEQAVREMGQPVYDA